jgi:hypothetical protein
LYSLTFVTNKGTKSPNFGNGRQATRKVTVPDGYRIIGLYGIVNSWGFYSFGLKIAKLIYTSCALGVGMMLFN